jgi:hypothetical protein
LQLTRKQEISEASKIINVVDLPDFITPDRVLNNTGRDHIRFGTNNLFPQEMSKLSREVGSHRSILNSKTRYITGNKITSEDTRLTELIKAFNVNESMIQVLKKGIFDFLSQGNAYLELVTNSRRDFLFTYHHDSTTARVNESGDAVILNGDWEKRDKKKDKVISYYPDWIEEDGLLRSMLHMKSYEPEFVFYGLPSFYAALRSARISGKTNQWNETRLDNEFSSSGMLIVPGVNSVPAAKKVQEKLDKMSGAGNNAKILPHYMKDVATGSNRAKAEFIAFDQDQEGNWLKLHESSENDLLRTHSWYRSLAAFTDSTGFDTDRILNEYEIALGTVIEPTQNEILQILGKAYEEFGYDFSEINWINKSPIKKEASPYMKVWEARRADGLEYDKDDESQKMYVAELTKNGTNNTNRSN